MYGCALLGVVEQDSRHSPADLGLEARRAPADLAHVLADVEFLEYQRRAYLERAMVERLVELVRLGKRRRGRSEPPSPRCHSTVPPWHNIDS